MKTFAFLVMMTAVVACAADKTRIENLHINDDDQN
jgi:hypothetical protein